MAVKPLPIFTYFNRARFTQAGSADLANWYNVDLPDCKSERVLYPAMGRKHFEFLGQDKLIFDAEPRFIFRSIEFVYVIVGTRVFQVDKFYNTVQLTGAVSLSNDIWFEFLAVNTTVYCMLTDGVDVFVITESRTASVVMQKCTDSNRPDKPSFITVFGNRFVVSVRDTPQSHLSQIDLGAAPTDPSTWFTIPDGGAGFALFFQASGIVRQLASINQQMYIFTDFNVDIWANIPTQITVAGTSRDFPFKLNSATSWNFGIADPHSLAVGFNMMVWLGRNFDGLVTFLMSTGQMPQSITNQAVDVLLESQVQNNGLSPFLSQKSTGFLYKWEKSIFYRVIAGKFLSFGKLDLEDSANAIEYNFNTKRWARVIELDGARNRISKHVYLNNKHFVIVEGETALYEMRGDVYTNELQVVGDPTSFTKQPMRYELITGQLYQPDYSEFITDYVEIDFVFGYKTFYKSSAPFDNTVYITDEDGAYIVTEDSTADNPIFLIQDGTNTPSIDDHHYNTLFNPHVELYFSDDGGMTFSSADLREFSQLGKYSWRMRWYQLGASRNRVYKLVCVSAAPIVILGAVHDIRRISGGAN